MTAFNVWWVLMLPPVGLTGLLCAAFAQAYAGCIARGAHVDGATACSALRLAGRAVLRALQHPVSRVSPLSAALSAGLLVLGGLPVVLQPSILTVAQYAACVVLLVLALVDTRCGLLPDALTLPLLWAGLLLAWAGVGVSLHDAVAGAAAGYLLLRGMNAVFVCFRGHAGMGGGDMKLVAALGAWLGWAALPEVVLAACLGGVLFTVIRLGRRSWQSSLAFGPFLAAAGAFGLVGGPVVQFVF